MDRDKGLKGVVKSLTSKEKLRKWATKLLQLSSQNFGGSVDRGGCKRGLQVLWGRAGNE